MTCCQCGKTFRAKECDARRFCSTACYHDAGRGLDRAQRIAFACEICGKPFYRAPGELRAYRKAHGQDPKFCSRQCGYEAKKLTDAEWESARVSCVQCGKLMPIQRRPGGTLNRQKKLCSTTCRSAFRSQRAPTPFTEGGYAKHVKRGGYVWISLPAWASPTGKKREMLEHRYIMEKMLGRMLRPEETVHHMNGQRADNRPENLSLRSGHHGPGGDVAAMIRWAHEFIALYPQFDREGNLTPVEIPSVVL